MSPGMVRNNNARFQEKSFTIKSIIRDPEWIITYNLRLFEVYLFPFSSCWLLEAFTHRLFQTERMRKQTVKENL